MMCKLALGMSLGLASLTLLPAVVAPPAWAELSAQDRAEVLKARAAVWHAWFADDQAALKKLLPEDTLAINNGEEKWQSRQEILDSAKQFADEGGHLVRLEFPRIEVQSFGNVAVVYSLFVTETESHGRRTTNAGRATVVFVRRNGQWLNPGWHLDSGK